MGAYIMTNEEGLEKETRMDVIGGRWIDLFFVELLLGICEA